MSAILSHQNIANGTAVPSAETAIAVSPVNIVTVPAVTKVIIRATVNVLAGTGTTAVVARIRQGNGVGGNVLATATITLAAGNNGQINLSVEDTAALLAAAAGGQYSLTLAQTGGSANGSVNAGDLQVDIFP